MGGAQKAREPHQPRRCLFLFLANQTLEKSKQVSDNAIKLSVFSIHLFPSMPTSSSSSSYSLLLTIPHLHCSRPKTSKNNHHNHPPSFPKSSTRFTSSGTSWLTRVVVTMLGHFPHLFSRIKMSQLSRSDAKTLALCLYDDPTRHDADHDKIRSLITSLPCHLRDSKLASIFAEPHHTVKPCLVHEGIAPLVVSYLFTSLQKEVVDSVPLLKKYGPYLGPEEIYILERVITIEGMWSPPTARTEPPKFRYWDYQVNKCQACMVSRIASDASALRDMRILILASIDSSPTSHDPRLLPNHPTTLSFVNEWISLSSRADELFYLSGIQSASIKAAKQKLEDDIAASPTFISGNTNFSNPHGPLPDYASSYSSYQSTAVFSPGHTPETSTSSKNSNTFEWGTLRRYAISNSSSESTTTPSKFFRFRKLKFSPSSQRSEPLLFLPPKQEQPCLVDSVPYSNSLHSSTYSASPPVLGAGSFVERDTRTPRPYDSPEYGQNSQKPVNSTNFANPMSPGAPRRDSFSSFILRDSPSTSQPQRPPSPRRAGPSRFGNPIPQWEGSGVGLVYGQRPTQNESSWTFVNSDASSTDAESLPQGLQEPFTSTVNLHGQSQEDEDDAPLISRWSTTTTTGHTWTNLLKKSTAFGPRLGKVKTGKGLFKSDAERDGKKKSRMAMGG